MTNLMVGSALILVSIEIEKEQEKGFIFDKSSSFFLLDDFF